MALWLAAFCWNEYIELYDQMYVIYVIYTGNSELNYAKFNIKTVFF